MQYWYRFNVKNKENRTLLFRFFYFWINLKL